MLSQPAGPRRVLMTLDAMGGVWRYALDLAAAWREMEIETVLAGFGPRPDAARRAEAEAVAELVWTDQPLDWMVEHPRDLGGVPRTLLRLADEVGAEAIQLNSLSQAAGLEAAVPVLAVAHSCVPTWFRAVRGLPPEGAWAWHAALNAEALARADRVVAPSRAHADALQAAYPGAPPAAVVPNAVSLDAIPQAAATGAVAFAAGRWWDEGKGAAILDAAAARTETPLLAAGPLARDGDGRRGGPQHRFRHACALGPQSHAECLRLVARAGIFVSPSIYEPFGLAALEAAAAGAGLVLSDIPVYRELWEGAALFAPPRDPAAFAAAVDRLAEDPRRRADLGARARARAVELTPRRQALALRRILADIQHREPC